MKLEKTTFAALPGWEHDGLEGALSALTAIEPAIAAANWCALLGVSSAGARDVTRDVEKTWSEARAMVSGAPAEAKAFIERAFRPVRFLETGAAGDTGALARVTGYYEPDVAAARMPSPAYPVPLLARPDDLVNLVSEDGRALGAGQYTHARRTDAGPVPYATRAQIEEGALDGRGLEFAWLADPVDAFFLHVQGSGRLVFEDGGHCRVTYDGKNGHPYTSIGAELIAEGLMDRAGMTLESLGNWLRTNREAARDIMRRNRSYVFFRPLRPDEADAAHGVLSTPLHPLRSLAVDTRFHALGAPVFVSAPRLAQQAVDGAEATPDRPGFARLMFAHDVGSAIRGPHRGDIYYGSGSAAGRRAGATNHDAELFPLLPVVLAEAMGLS